MILMRMMNLHWSDRFIIVDVNHIYKDPLTVLFRKAIVLVFILHLIAYLFIQLFFLDRFRAMYNLEEFV